ncbi:hypothetical protein BG418_17740 [Streptomyces sp. CBMA152]|nr:hypothetical protein [Streptomyces sp. CBMA152]
MAYGRADRGCDRVLVQGAARRAAAHAAAAAHRGVGRDVAGPIGRAAGEQAQDLGLQTGGEAHVLGGPPERVACAAACAGLRVGQAALFGGGERGLLDEDALTFVTAPTAVEADHDGGERALLAGAARQGRVAARQEDEMAEVRAVQTSWRARIQDEPGERALLAFGAAVTSSGFYDENGRPPLGGSPEPGTRGAGTRDAANEVSLPFSIPQ